jgi:NAD-dependent SIR2 family protein deacetylase
MNECESGVWSATNFTPQVNDGTCRLLNEPPHCPHCGGLARPNILMFGDWNWLVQRSQEQRQRETRWLESLSDNQARVVVIEIGAGTAIPSVRHFSHRISHDYGARIIRVNLRDSQVPSFQDIGFPSGALEALRGIELAFEKLVSN